MRLAGVPLRTEPSRLDLCINALSDTQEASGCCPASGKAQSCELAFVIIPASSHWVKGPAVMDNSKYRGPLLAHTAALCSWTYPHMTWPAKQVLWCLDSSRPFQPLAGGRGPCCFSNSLWLAILLTSFPSAPRMRFLMGACTFMQTQSTAAREDF